MDHFTLSMNRRRMLKMAGCGFGYLALTSLLSELGTVVAAQSPLAPKPAPLTARAKRIIFMFMHGGPSHVDTFDYRPLLARDAGKPLPRSLAVGTSDPNGKLMPSPFEFKKHGKSGIEISEI